MFTHFRHLCLFVFHKLFHSAHRMLQAHGINNLTENRF